MVERGSLLIGLLAASTLIVVAFLAVLLSLSRLNALPKLAGGGDVSTKTSSASRNDLLQQAEDVKAQANLKSVSTALVVYYSEFSRYPDSLDEISSYLEGIDTTNIEYTKCSEGEVVFYHNLAGYPGYIHNHEAATSTGGSPPTCD